MSQSFLCLNKHICSPTDLLQLLPLHDRLKPFLRNLFISIIKPGKSSCNSSDGICIITEVYKPFIAPFSAPSIYCALLPL